MNYVDHIRALGACDDAIDWLRQSQHPDLQTAWYNCERGDWMLWLVGKLDASEPWSDERKPLVLCACECARLAWAWMPPDSRHALEVLDAWTRGEVSTADAADATRAAVDAAYAAACAAAAADARAACAARAAAYAAADAAYAAAAADTRAAYVAAADAADAVACAAAAAYVADATHVAARVAYAAADARAACAAAQAAYADADAAIANIVLQHYPLAPRIQPPHRGKEDGNEKRSG